VITRRHAMNLRIFVAHPSSLLTDYRPHGDGLLAFRFISELANRGHQLHVAAEQVDLSAPPPANVHVYQLGSIRIRGATDRLRYMRRIRGIFTDLHRRQAFDIVHQLNPVHVGLTLSLARVHVPIVLGPYVPDWHDRNHSGSGRRAVAATVSDHFRWVLAALQQRGATAALLSTPAAASKLAAPPVKLQVHELPYGIDARVWVPDDDHEARQDVLFVGRLHVHKGVFVLLESFEMVALRLPHARLRIGGAGPAADELERRARRSAVRSRIEILGGLDRQQVLRATQGCDVYCLPSFGEPFGLGALEAMACGKPVIGTNESGLRYLVDDAGGRQIPPGDVPALANALSELLSDPALRRKMGRHNRELVEARYAWPRVIDRLEQIYMRSIESFGARERHSRKPFRRS
jgi:L-malate glycosyltransferase